MPDPSSIEAKVAERALEYLLAPPSGDDAVINLSSPDELVAAFDGNAGLGFDAVASGETDEHVLAAVDQVLHSSVRTVHPRFMNQNFAGPDPVSVVGDWLGAALNTTAATFEAAPVFTLMESALLSKLARVAGYLPAAASPLPALPPGLFAPGGSSATLYALQLARHRRNPEVVRTGIGTERLVLFVSDAGHYAATKSAAMLVLGTDAVIKVASDFEGAIMPEALADAVVAAKGRGETPFAVIGTAGTTVTSAFDDLNAVADVCVEHDLWFHVDGCYGGSALFSPKHRHLLDGVERSDSFVWNLHKMMGMTQQCSALLVRDPSQLAPCFAGHADYLFQPDKLNADYDSGDRTFQCARRVDALKLWLSWKVRGDEGFAARVEHAYDMAAYTRSRITESGGAFAVVVPGSFTNVVFAWVPPDLRPLDLANGAAAQLDQETMDRLHALPPTIKAQMQAEGTGMIGYQPIHGLNTFRMLFMNPAVSTDDVDAILAAIERYGAAALSH